MSKHTKGNGTEDATSVIVVTPDNMGERLDFDNTYGKYNVNVKDLLTELSALRKDVDDLRDRQNVNVSPQADKPNEFFNLDTNLTGLGMKVFFGNIVVNTNGLDYDRIQQGTGRHIPNPCIVKGFPVKPIDRTTNSERISPGYKETDFEGHQDYDFSGYQFASPVEVVQVVFHQSRMAVRTNDAGMNADGTFINPRAWGKWVSV